MTSKYKAQKTIIDGITFASKKEANYYLTLKDQQQRGEISYFLRQVPFHLPGGVKYVCDFVVFDKRTIVIGDAALVSILPLEVTSTTVTFIDVKGIRTAMYKTKKKLVEALYPIKIEEV